MRRFIATYRWELWLLLWAPLLSSIAPVAAQLLFSVFADESEYPFFFFYYSMPSVVAGLAEAGLLLAFYARVRRLERRFLTLVWATRSWPQPSPCPFTSSERPCFSR